MNDHEARALLRAHKVEIGMDDRRGPLEIAQSLALLAIEPVIADVTGEVSYNITNE